MHAKKVRNREEEPGNDAIACAMYCAGPDVDHTNGYWEKNQKTELTIEFTAVFSLRNFKGYCTTYYGNV